MIAIENLSHRDIAPGVALGGLLVGARVAGYPPIREATCRMVLAPNLLIAVAPGGDVTITVSRSGMGIGLRTSLAMALADELDADQDRVRVVPAHIDPTFEDRITDSLTSIRLLLGTTREVGATIRHMLVAAAAARWGIGVGACETRHGVVARRSGAQVLRYGDLVADAAKLPVPAREHLVLRTPVDWRCIGESPPIVAMHTVAGVQHSAVASISSS